MEKTYTFYYNLKRCGSQHRLFKFRKTDIADWYAQIPAIIQRELSADAHILVYDGSPEGLSLLQKLGQSEKMHVISTRDFSRQKMLETLAAQGNQQAASELQGDTGSVQKTLPAKDAEPLEEIETASVDQTELRTEKEAGLSSTDSMIFQQLMEMDADPEIPRFPIADVETLLDCVNAFLLQTKEDIRQFKYVSVYIKKILEPSSAYKYLGAVLFSDAEKNFVECKEGGLLGFRFLSLCLSEEFECIMETEGGVIQRFALEEE